jgi:hypothetical protein
VPEVVGYALTDCPKCGAKSGERCYSLNYRPKREDKRTSWPHQARVARVEAWAFNQLQYMAIAVVMFRKGHRDMADELLTIAMMWDELPDPHARCNEVIARCNARIAGSGGA